MILGIIIIVSLILIATKELAMTSEMRFAVNLSRSLTAPILIIAMMFVLLIVLEIVGILR